MTEMSTTVRGNDVIASYGFKEPTFKDRYAQNVVPISYYECTHNLFTARAGYLGVWAVLSRAGMSTGSAVSPIANYDSSTQKASISFPPDSVLNSTVVWKTAVVWGTLTNEGFTAVWENRRVTNYTAISRGRELVSDSRRVGVHEYCFRRTPNSVLQHWPVILCKPGS